jgi:aryl-alcohol dehydrogenase-like predicted oxidoreductase
MGMTGYYGFRNDRESLDTIDRALELGVNFLDTADMYGQGLNETFLRRAICGRRQNFVLATKFGNILDQDGNFLKVNGHPDYVRIACEASLQRLRIDVIDLYYLHRIDPTVPIEETIGAMADLVSQGKVRFIGLSEAGPVTLRRAHDVHPITALQTEYSLWSREPEDEILSACRELGIGFVAYCPLGRGLLTGRIGSVTELPQTDTRRRAPRFESGNLPVNLGLVERLKRISLDVGCTPAQIALAWLLAQGEDIVPIPGTKRRKYLDENVQALNIKLSEEIFQIIDEIMPKGVAAGPRYSDAMMKLVNI